MMTTSAHANETTTIDLFIRPPCSNHRIIIDDGLLARCPANQTHEVVLGVPENRHPYILIAQLAHDMGFVVNFYIAALNIRSCLLYVVHIEVDHGTGMIQLRSLGLADKEKNSSALRNGNDRRADDYFQLQCVAIESGCSLQVFGSDGNLGNL